MSINPLTSLLGRLPVYAKRADVWLGVLVAVVLKGMIVPKASFLSNIIHIAYKLVQVFQRPMHKIPESDLAAINKQRFLYSLLTMMEPKCKVKQESISFRSDTGHQIDIELQRPLHSEDKICPMVIFYHGGGFVIGNVRCMTPNISDNLHSLLLHFSSHT